jgi:DNA-binding NtrC family response regulator
VRLLVTDLVMPGGVSGVELARRLRAERPDLRVIAMSGYSATLTHDRADLGPATAFIPKPFEINRILDLVHEQLTLARGSGAPFAAH